MSQILNFFLEVGDVLPVEIAGSLGRLSVFFLLNFGPFFSGKSVEGIIYFFGMGLLQFFLAYVPLFVVGVFAGGLGVGVVSLTVGIDLLSHVK